jgi:hypothetical protein
MRDADIAQRALRLHVAQRRQLRAPIDEVVDLHQIDDPAFEQPGRTGHLVDAALPAADPHFGR